MRTGQKTKKKIKIGWFVFSCSGDNTIIMVETMNEYWQKWRKTYDFKYARVFRNNNILKDIDIAFVEGAIASERHKARLELIRKESKKLVAVGSCAITGLPAGQRNSFSLEQQETIDFLLKRFAALPRVLRVSDVVKVDEIIPGCPMKSEDFVKVLNKLTSQLDA